MILKKETCKGFELILLCDSRSRELKKFTECWFVDDDGEGVFGNFVDFWMSSGKRCFQE